MVKKSHKQHQHLSLLDIYKQFAYEWTLNTDHIRWQSVSRLLFGELSFYETGERFATQIDLTTFDQRIEGLHQHLSQQKDFSLQYSLCVQGDKCCTVHEQGRIIPNPQTKTAVLAGSIKPISDFAELQTPKKQKDPLTGLLTKTAISNKLETMLNQKPKKPTQASFLQVAFMQPPLLGIHHGIEQMHNTIKNIAKCIQNATRSEDILGRISGNSFGLILPNCDPQEMAVVAKKIIHAIDNAAIKTTTNGPPIQVSTTGGIPFPLGAQLPVHALFRGVSKALLNAQTMKSLAVTVPPKEYRESDLDSSKISKRKK